MSRRHLEEAIIQSQLIEHGLEPKFRFSRIDAFRSIPPFADFDEGIYSLQYTANGKKVAVGTSSGAVRIHDIAQPSALLEPMPSKFRYGLAITCLRTQPTVHDKLFASSASGQLFTMLTDRIGFELVLTEKGNEINSIDFSPNGSFLATGGKDANIRIYSGVTLDPLATLSSYSAMDHKVLNGHSMRIFAIRFSPDNANLLFSAGWDNDIKLWDVRIGGSAVGHIKGPHVCGDGIDMQGATLLTCSWTCFKALQLWDIRQLGLICSLPCAPGGGQEFLYAGRFTDNATVVVGGSGFTGLAAVSISTGEIYGKIAMPGPVFALDTVFGGRGIAVGSSDGTVKLANMR